MILYKETNVYLLSPIIRRHKALTWLCLYCITLVMSVQWLWHYSYEQLQTTNQQQLDRFSRHLDSQLGHFAYIPQLLSHQEHVIKALQTPDNLAQLDITNRHLHSINTIIGAADAYLLDKEGNTIAASNWDKKTTFIGHNFSFRPYFQDAKAGKQGRYFALGLTSGKRGYYFSYPVTYAAEVIGVVVVKMDLSFIERDWADKKQIFLVTDQHNVVFISSQSKWLFHGLSKLNDTSKQLILNSRRYLDREIKMLSVKGNLDKEAALIEIDHPTLPNNYLSLIKRSENQHWNIRVLAPITPLIFNISMLIILLSLLFMLLYLLSILVRQKRNRVKEKESVERKLKQRLELTVMQRTSSLQAEIQERERAEEALISTQKELIQAAKLAMLGQLSASISHELNNPLSAIRSYAENSVLFLEREQFEDVASNLKSISLLTERMAKISAQLKSFARKSDGHLQEIALQPVIVAAHELLKPQLKAARTLLLMQIPDELVFVKAEPIQLEQIIVNILSNALQAMQDCQRKLIEVKLSIEEDNVIIKVLDIGQGIKDDDLPHLFDPFFTTKETGLGLGLSISHQIITSMKGKLVARNRKSFGAIFCIILPLSTSPDKNIEGK